MIDARCAIYPVAARALKRSASDPRETPASVSIEALLSRDSHPQQAAKLFVTSPYLTLYLPLVLPAFLVRSYIQFMCPAGRRLLRYIPIGFSQALLINKSISIKVVDINVTSFPKQTCDIV